MAGKIDDATEEEVCAMYLAGMSGFKIREELGLDLGTVYNILRRRGIPRRAVGRGGDPNQDWEVILDEYQKRVVMAGTISVEKFCEEMGISYSQLNVRLKLMQMPTIGQANKALRAERDLMAVKLYVEDKWPIAEICAQLNLDMPRLYVILRKAKVEFRRAVNKDDIKSRLEHVKALRAQYDQKKINEAKAALEARQVDGGQAGPDSQGPDGSVG